MRIVLVGALVACTIGPEPQKPSSITTCDGTWEPYACLDAGKYFESRGDIPRAVEMFDRGCKRRLFDACVAGSNHSLEIAVPACEMGYRPACMKAARYLDRDVAKSVALLDGICTREPWQCGEAARILLDRDEAAAVEMTRRACASSDRAACTLAVKLPFRHVKHREEVGRLGCAIDLAEPCFDAASVTTEDRRPLLERACQLKLQKGCEELGLLLSRP